MLVLNRFSEIYTNTFYQYILPELLYSIKSGQLIRKNEFLIIFKV